MRRSSKRAFILLVSSFFCLTSSFAHAGKVEIVQRTVKVQCGQDLATEEALQLVKELYLNCVPDTKIEVNEKCSVVCLRENIGVVVGR